MIRIGDSSSPYSSTCDRPVISPAPLRTPMAAGTGAANAERSCGWMAVTPVRAGPLPTRSAPSPWMTVVCPTRTPSTSVIAFSGPGGKLPMMMPRSRRRGRSFMVVDLHRRDLLKRGGLVGHAARHDACVRASSATLSMGRCARSRVSGFDHLCQYRWLSLTVHMVIHTAMTSLNGSGVIPIRSNGA